METKMAKVQRKGQAPKYIPNCVNYKGYLAQQVQVGVGESHTVGGMFNGEGDVWEEWDRYEKRLKPFFDADKLSAGQRAELSKKLEDKEFNQIQKVIDAGYEFALMKWGEHEKYSVQDQNEIENAKKLEKEKAFENKELTINFIPGFFGLQISERLPKSVWAIVQPFGTYHQGNEDDLEWLDDLGHIGIHPNEVRGWYYEDKAIGALISEGFSVSYREEKITSNASEEIRRIDGEIKKEQDEFYAEVKAVRAGWEKFSLRLSEMRQNAEYISEMEAEEISKTERITLPGWEFQFQDGTIKSGLLLDVVFAQHEVASDFFRHNLFYVKISSAGMKGKDTIQSGILQGKIWRRFQ